MNYQDINENNLEEYWDYLQELDKDQPKYWIILISLCNYNHKDANELMNQTSFQQIKYNIFTNEEFEKFIKETSGLGLSESMNKLGAMYYCGKGVAPNYRKSTELFQVAIEKGNQRAMNNLALMYKNGKGVEQDYQKAIALCHNAILGGIESAMNLYIKICVLHPEEIAIYMKKMDNKFLEAKKFYEKMEEYVSSNDDKYKKIMENFNHLKDL